MTRGAMLGRQQVLCERPVSLFLSEWGVDRIIFPVTSLPVTRTEAFCGPHIGGSEQRGVTHEGGSQVQAGKAPLTHVCPKAKASGKKLQKVTLKVSPRGIILTDNVTNQLIENVSIYRISYCTADKMHDKVFAYIAQSQHSENLECHAFLCTKRKMAQAVTLTVAQAFKVAFEFWQVSREEKEKREKANQDGTDILGGGRQDSAPSLKSLVVTGNLLDLEETAKAPLSTVSANTTNTDEPPRPQALNSSSVVWELDDGLDEAFSRLAQSRTNPQVLDTGLTAQDIHYAQCLSPVDWNKADSGGAEPDDLFNF
uniref:Low density lipoprotein receptor adaptor protein 1 n=1 Tax=Ovis aries TaxID=9940 RepID=A0AC11D0R1_SHEEP